MDVAIIDYGSGNLRSAAKAVERAGRDQGRAPEVVVTADPERAARADRLVLPGVGAFGDCRRGLDALDGMVEALGEAVIDRGRPFLGICVGMQLTASIGREHGDTPGLDWIAGEVVALAPGDPALKVPHMGWNELVLVPGRHPVLDALASAAAARPVHAYFLHGYQLLPEDPRQILAQADYGGRVVAAVGRDNILGTQFHPEKSQAAGLALLAGFLAWRPTGRASSWSRSSPSSSPGWTG